jgi:hypothetical protein
MSVASVGLSQSVGSGDWRTSVRQARLDFDQIVQSLQSGNLTAAQQAYSGFQQLQAGLTNTAATSTGSSSTSSTATNPVTSDWAALGQALQNGSLSSAQDALGKLEQDAQTAWQTHLQQETQNAQSVYALLQSTQQAAATSGTTAAGDSTAAASVQNDLTALNQALQSGDTSTAQKVLAQLEQDLQASGQTFAGHRHHHHGLSGLSLSSAYPTSTTVSSGNSTTTGSTSSTGAVVAGTAA